LPSNSCANVFLIKRSRRIGNGTEFLNPGSMIAQPPGIKPLIETEYFHDQYFERDVTSLHPDRLYQSAGREVVLGEYFSFEPTEKVCTRCVFQKTQNHLFQSGQCEQWRKALKMLSDWTFAIVHLLDNSHNSCPKVLFVFFTLCVQERLLGDCV